jgi:hypothetical protein
MGDINIEFAFDVVDVIVTDDDDDDDVVVVVGNDGSDGGVGLGRIIVVEEVVDCVSRLRYSPSQRSNRLERSPNSSLVGIFDFVVRGIENGRKEEGENDCLLVKSVIGSNVKDASSVALKILVISLFSPL